MSNAAMNVSSSIVRPAEPRPSFRLRLLLREVSFDTDEVTIGRGSDCAMSIDDDLLSRRHATIRRRGDGYGFEIVDLGSRNGTRLNGRAVRVPTPLAPTDRIRLGSSEIIFLLEPDAIDENRSRKLATASFVACLACGQARAAEILGCPRCGAPSPTVAG